MTMAASTFGLIVLFVSVCSALDPRSEVLDFLRKQNFWQRCQSEAACIPALKQFCGMQHVGGTEISAELLACVRRSKCGLPILPSLNQSATFLEEMPKFEKKRLTYTVLNTATKTILTHEETLKMVEMSTEVWKCYTPLEFSFVSSLKEADLILSFTPRVHGYHNYFTKEYVERGWDFDGPGGVLAHAFLPYHGASNMGNFHWDDDETWIENHRSGVKIFHTTVHELGHNLGLPHTPQQGNIMYGGYDDSYHETELDLGPYDKYEIQLRYGSRQCNRKVWQEYYKNKYPGGDTTCEDRTSCSKYQYSKCLNERTWMSENCAKHCGFCGECKDTSNRCSDYDKERCSRDAWFVSNCKEFCGFCAAEADPQFGITYEFPKYPVRDEVCATSRIEGAFKSSSSLLYLIINGVLFRYSYRFKQFDPQFRKRLSDLWDRRLVRPSAATYMPLEDALLLFQGRDLFIVSNFSSSKAKASNLRLPGSLASPRAAFMGRFLGASVVHVVHGSKVSSISVSGNAIKILATRPFADLFDAGGYKARIPRTVDSAFQDGGAVFFMTGSSATIAYPEGDRYTLPNSGLKPFMTNHLGCPQVF